VVEELLNAFGMNLGVGYDVGCHFGATVANSSLSDEAQEKNLKCVVGSTATRITTSANCGFWRHMWRGWGSRTSKGTKGFSPAQMAW
jgi:hypothetical protein